MSRVKQEVKIKWGLGTPRLRGRLKPVVIAPIKKILSAVVKDKPAVYIEPIPLKPIIPEAVEPTLAEPIKPIIPEYIGDPNEQQEIIHKAPVDEPATNQSREITPTVEDAPRAL